MKLARAILGWTLIVLLAGVVALVGTPRLFGGSTLTVLTGSMQPGISPGDAVAVFPVDPADLVEGDIVTFQPVSGDPMLITHRIISITQSSSGERSFVTRGDANTADDEPIVAAQIQGQVHYAVPYIGQVGAAVGPLAPTLIMVLAIVLVVGGAIAVLRPARTRSVPEPVAVSEPQPVR